MLTLSPHSRILLTATDPLSRFAATELQRTLQRLGGPHLPIATGTGPAALTLSAGPAGDGFVYLPQAAGCRLVADGPRGLLFGVYALLEQLGCRWAAPGSDGELLPQLPQITLPAAAFAEQPAVSRRVLILAADELLNDAERWISWAAHARATSLFVHTVAGALPIGACRSAAWRRARARLLPLLAARGLSLELGGHLNAELLPARLRRRVPQLQRLNTAGRRDRVNACLSSPAARQALQQAAAAFARAEPAVDVFHLWPDDRPAGGWCRCPDCTALSAADQALRFANTVAAGVTSVRPDARVSFLAYHETADTALTLPVDPAVELCFAPRTRSYAAAIDAADPLNQPHAAALQRLQPAFAGRPPLIFEYYSDGLLHKSVLPVFDDLLAADARAYAAAGCGVALLLTGDRACATPGPTPYQLLHLLWDPARDPDQLRADYLSTRASVDPPRLAAAYRAAAQIWQTLLAQTPAERPPPIGALSLDAVADPPRDTLDSHLAAPPLAEARLQRLQQLTPLAEVLQPPAAAESAAAAADWAELQALADLWQALLARQQLSVLINRGAARPALRAALRRARLSAARRLQHHSVGWLSAALHDLQLAALELRCVGPLARLNVRRRALIRLAAAVARRLLRGTRPDRVR
jgi:hypothetical protein